MINLIPTDQKRDITFGRHNASLLKWVFGILIAVIGLAVIVGGGMFYLKQDSNTYRNSIKQAEASLKEQNEAATLKRVEEISGRLSLVVNVLSKEVMFSKLLPHVGALMPEGTILRDLSLSRDQVGGLDLSIGAVDEFAASQALVNLQDSDSLLFENADANMINCEGDEEDIYICTATIRAQIVGENPFLLLNQGNNDVQ